MPAHLTAGCNEVEPHCKHFSPSPGFARRLLSISALQLPPARALAEMLTSRCKRRADKRRRKPERAEKRGLQEVHPSATRCEDTIPHGGRSQGRQISRWDQPLGLAVGSAAEVALLFGGK
jgi:hypothetical protein